MKLEFDCFENSCHNMEQDNSNDNQKEVGETVFRLSISLHNARDKIYE